MAGFNFETKKPYGGSVLADRVVESIPQSEITENRPSNITRYQSTSTPVDYTPPVVYKFNKNDWSYLSNSKPIDYESLKPKNATVYTPKEKKKEEVVVPEVNKAGALAGIGYTFLGSVAETLGNAAQFIIGMADVAVKDTKSFFEDGGKSANLGSLATEPLRPMVLGKDAREKAVSESKAESKTDKQSRNAYLFDIYTGQNKDSALTPVLDATRDWTKNTVGKLTEKADMQNEGYLAQTAANAAASVPYTAASLLPFGIGLYLNYGSSYTGSMQQKMEEASGKPLTNEQKSNITTYAGGSALISSAVESLFKISGGATAVVKAVGKTPIKTVVKETIKFLNKNGVEEATEEGLTYIGQGLLAKITTDPDKDLLGISSGSALINFEDFSSTMESAYATGVLFTLFGLGGGKAKEKYDGFVNTKKALSEIAETPVDEVTEEQSSNVVRAIVEDGKNPDNAQAISRAVAETLPEAEQDMPISQQISSYRNLLIALHDDSSSYVTPEEKAQYKRQESELNAKIFSLESQKTALTPAGKKMTVAQIEKLVTKKEALVAETKQDILNAPSDVEKKTLERNLQTYEKSLNQYKALLVPAPTSAELLAKMQNPVTQQRSTMPANAQTAIGNEILQPQAQTGSNEAVASLAGAPARLPKTKIEKNGDKYMILVRTDKDLQGGYDYEPAYDGVRLFNTEAEAQAEADKYVDKEAPQEEVAPNDISDETIDLSNAEVISQKSSTGKVYRIRNKVYKSGKFGVNGKATLEAKVYSDLQGVDVVASGVPVIIDGEPYIELPYFERVISIDTIPREDRGKYRTLVADNADRIIEAVQELSNAGYNYNDPLQFGYSDGKFYLMDFSNVSDGDPKEALHDNYNRLGNYFKAFGLDKMDYIVSRGMELRRNLESVVDEDVNSEDYKTSLLFTPEKIRATVDEMKRARGDMAPNNVYYATNGRGIEIGNIAQTDRIDGVKHIFSDTPLSDKVVEDWEMKPIYVQKQGSQTKEAPQETPRKAESFKEKATPVKPAIDSKYNSLEEVEQAIDDLREEASKFDSLPPAEKEIARIKLNLQAFALKKELAKFVAPSAGNRYHSFVDTFTRILQSGSTKDMAKFMQENLSLEQMTYERLANKSEIEKSDAEIAKGGDTYKKDLFNDFMNNPAVPLNPNQVVSLARYLVELTKSDDVDLKKKGFDGLTELNKRFTKAGQFTQAAKAVLNLYSNARSREVTKELEKNISPIDTIDLKKEVENTKKTAGKFVEKGIDDSTKDFEKSIDKGDSDAVDARKSKRTNKKLSMEEMLAAIITRDINGHKREKEQKADTIALNVLHNIYLEMNPSAKGKETNVFNTLSIMASNKEKYADVWDKAKPKVEALIAAENKKRLASGLESLDVPENYLERYAHPDFTVRMMNQAIRQVLNDSGTSMRAEARKFYLDEGDGAKTIERFVTGLRYRFDDAYGQAMPDETFEYLKTHIVKQFKKSLSESRTDISKSMRAQAERAQSADKNPVTRKARMDKFIDQLTDSVISGALNDDALSTIWAKKMGLTHISDEMRAEISKTIVEIDKIEDESKRFLAYQDFVEKLGNHIIGDNMMKMKAWRRFAMLCSPRTWTRNGISNYANLPYAKVMDGVTYRIQKAIGLQQEYMNRGTSYIKAGANKEIDSVVDSTITDALIRVTLEESGKWDIGQNLRRESRIFKSDKLEALTKAPLYIISEGKLSKNAKRSIPFFGDQHILKVYFTEAFRNKLNALGYKESLPDAQKAKMKQEALKTAKEVSVTRTYRAASVISELFIAIKGDATHDSQIRELTKTGDQADLAKARQRRKHLEMRSAAVDIVVPFVNTPLAIATEGYRYSPVAGIMTLAEALGMRVIKKQTAQTNPHEYARLSKQMSQALVGTAGQWIIGAGFALAGMITGAPPDKEKERKEWALEGKTPYSLYIPGMGWISYAWCQPVALGIMGGADIATVIRNGGYNISAIPSAMSAGFNGVIGATLYGSIVDNTFGGATAADNFKNAIMSGATQALPTLSKAIASSLDPYVRDTYSGSTVQVLQNRILSYVPLASMLQPVKVDIWGNPVKASDAGAGILGRTVLNMIAPFTLGQTKTDPVSAEVIRLFNATKETSSLPVVVNEKWEKSSNGKKYSFELSGQDYVDFQTLMGQEAFALASVKIADKGYINATDEEKVKMLKSVYATASDNVKLAYIEAHPQE